MRITFIIVRVLLGLLFLFASVSVLLNLIPPPPLTGKVKLFNEGLAAAGYFIPFLKVLELICAISLISGFYLRLFAIVLFPISVHIFLFHAFLDASAMPVSIFILLANIFIIYHYRKSYLPMLEAR